MANGLLFSFDFEKKMLHFVVIELPQMKLFSVIKKILLTFFYAFRTDWKSNMDAKTL